MTAQKHTDQASFGSRTVTPALSTGKTGRKPWKKKTPVEVMLDQIEKIREGVTEREEELKQAKRQLQKLEEARKILEST
jgi:hypothetical protein